MKVGDYVRFKTLSREIKIGKVIEIVEPDNSNEFSSKKINVYDLDNNEVTVDDFIIKKGQLIDLIEVGDYVNGEKVINIIKKHKYLEVSDEEIVIDEKDIKSIVTKEQFEAMKYEIK